MKLGCAAWCFTSPHYAPPYEDAVRTIGELGFDALELIVFTERDLDEYYTPERCRSLRQLYESYGLSLSQLALYAYLVADLASLDQQRKQRAISLFERAADVAVSLGTQVINLVSNWAEGLQAPIAYPPSYIHPQALPSGQFTPKWRMQLPAHFDATAVWENYVDALRQCTAIAEQHGLGLAVEGHAHVIVSGTDALLRLMDQIPSPALGVNFDTGWHLIQREYLPLSLHKLKGKILHVHARDGDGLLCYNLPPGNGIVDWTDLLTTLRDLGYDGAVSLELGGYAEPRRFTAQARAYLATVLREVQEMNRAP